jgi:protein-L-isoaspartate(D-aspartate) O-methyltransferase
VSEPSTTSGFPWAEEWPEITDERVRLAFARVPREPFIPLAMRPWAEHDMALPIAEDQTISQPFIVAWMTQALRLQPGTKTLEIGTGSGFQTAILCELTTRANETPGQNVYSLERFPSLAASAAEVLHTVGYQPHLRLGDGAAGWPDAAPFDAIILTAAPAYLPQPLWDQLAEGGRLVAPLGAVPEEQMLWLVRKINGTLEATPLGEVRFVPLISPLLDDPALCIEVKR